MVTIDNLGKEVTDAAKQKLRRAGTALGTVVKSQAQRRIKNSGDSEHRYPELWSTRTGLGFRAGGKPLRDTGNLMRSLSSASKTTKDGLRVTLLDGSGYGVFHQAGFKTKGPNRIPLTHRAKRNPNMPGLVPGVDFVMAWRGVTVPQRKIFNTPPEDVSEFRDAVAMALRGG